jgi:tetratricopeptide (TPR) repeat protein
VVKYRRQQTMYDSWTNGKATGGMSSAHHSANRFLGYAVLLSIVLTPAPAIAREKKVVIRSQPEGAKVVFVGGWMVCKALLREGSDGVTPCTLSIDEGAFDPNGRYWERSKILGVPLKISVSKDGFRPVEVDLTEGPRSWEGRDVTGPIKRTFYFVKADKFEIPLVALTPGPLMTRAAPDPLQGAKDALADCKAFYEQNNPAQAVTACTVALGSSVDRPDPDIFHYRCMSSFLLNRLESALTDCQQLTRLRPTSDIGWNNTGLILQAMGRNVDAVASFTKALQLNANSVKGLRNRAMSYERLNRSADALDDYTSALKVVPGDADTLIMRARLYNRRRDCQLAESDAATAAAAATAVRRADALLERGEARVCQNRYDEAIGDFTAAMALNPTSALPFAKRCAAVLASNRAESALKDCDESLKRAPEVAYFYAQRAEVNLALRRYANALADTQNASRRGLRDAWIFDIEGQANEGEGHLDLALTDYDESLRLDPARAISYVHRARARRMNNDPAQARQDLAAAQRLLRSDPKPPPSVKAAMEAEARVQAGSH